MDKNLFLNDLKLLETENKSAVQLYNEISAIAMHRLQASAKKGYPL